MPVDNFRLHFQQWSKNAEMICSGTLETYELKKWTISLCSGSAGPGNENVRAGPFLVVLIPTSADLRKIGCENLSGHHEQCMRFAYARVIKVEFEVDKSQCKFVKELCLK